MTNSISKYLALVKFSHTIFALPFALIGFTLAITTTDYQFTWQAFLLIIVCMVTARNAAMGFNRYLDWKIDAKNPRTANREIPAGVISPKNALAFVIVNVILFMAATWFINPLCFLLSPVALIVILGYSYSKRFTALCHFILSFGLSIAPMGAWMAVTGEWSWLVLLYSGVVFFWVSGFDIIYSLQDEEFDTQEKLHSIPAMMGKKRALQLSGIIHFICFGMLIYIGYSSNFSWIGWTGITIFSGLLLYQHLIVKSNDLSRVNLAFGKTNGVASVLLATFIITDLLI